MTDSEIKAALRQTRVIALVGYSANPARPSHRVAAFLHRCGYRVIPVNPGLAGQVALGEEIRASLADIPAEITVDMVDVFRRPEALPQLVDEALAHLRAPWLLWTQLGVVHAAAAERVRAAGLVVIENRCPAIEIPRLFEPGFRVS
ncbi:CoA-binding protein [Candidatus Halocynthiibacter alkanivorans]|jgi:uncharacterized protein|uniref:CoA-binding protein n=1 Tax=Candidatus Halocynthiibacter alkanivorans TaxID=2267619 RepID=UPI000DF48246|nr:CoA-binding protein [Candidatus Halocynthiibacter alkanivorans]